MRKKLLAVSCGILFLLGTDHVFADQVSSPFLKLCEADGNAAGASTADAPIETDHGTQKAQEKPARSVEDVALSERLQDLIANKLQQYVTRPQDRTAVEAFYRERDFAPLWANAGGALAATQQLIDFLHGVAADGLDPKDYPTPTFADRSPERLAADELALTNSVVTFVRHASTGRVAFSRVSGSIYFDLKSPDLQQVLEKIASSYDIAATLDSFNPQQPQYKELKAALARARKTPDADTLILANKTKIQRAHQGGPSQSEVSSAKVDAILANMERWRWLPREVGTAYVMVNIPEMDRGLTKRKRHTSLASKVFGCPSYPVRQCDVNRLVGAVDPWPTELRPHLIWRSEITDILSSKIWRKTRHEYRCTQNFGVAGGMMC